jgi:ubiquinone/menaquinone biosynthesis C-methylase UbiE
VSDAPGPDWSFDPHVVGRSYGAVAEEYAAAFAADLDQLPVDREVLAEVADAARSQRPIVDLGCGPGYVAAYLEAVHRRTAIGIDLAPLMLAAARRREPDLAVAVGDIRALPLRDASCSGAVAFYSLQHLPRADLPMALIEIGRVLIAGAVLAIAAHLGEGELGSPTDWMGHHVESMAVTLLGLDELQNALSTAGFTVMAIRRREPLPHEYQGPRIYVTASRTG